MITSNLGYLGQPLIIYFWFGDLEAENKPRKQWFAQNSAFDREIGDLFLEDVEAALAGTWDEPARTPVEMLDGTPKGSLALIILLDQFPRNLFRGSARSFAGDERALKIAKAAVDRGFDQALGLFQRLFMYMPFEHSEELADQETSIALFTALGDQGSLDFAVRHCDVIKRFGRFPHRNKVLGRESSPEEIEFLKHHEAGF
jgi:uncharacterized protein (DUF924 family)